MLEFAIEKLISLLGPIASLGKEKRELKDTALRAIHTALYETKIYYRDIDRGMPSDSDREALLVKYWSAAAIPMRHIDEDFAVMCENKAEFWVKPADWNDEMASEYGIKLEEITEAYRRVSGTSSAGYRHFRARNS